MIGLAGWRDFEPAIEQGKSYLLPWLHMNGTVIFGDSSSF